MIASADSFAADAGMASAAPRHAAWPLYVQAHGATVSLDGEVLRVMSGDDRPVMLRLAEVSQVVLMGNVAMTTPCLHKLMRRGIPVSWHGHRGWCRLLARHITGERDDFPQFTAR